MKKILLSLLIAFPIILFAQNVGIGTTTPAEKLEIKNAHRSTVKISSNNFTDTSQLIFSNRDGSSAGTDFLITSNQEQGLSFTSKSDFGSNTNDSSLIIKPNGNIGIGVKAPSAKLQVNGNAIITGANPLEFGGGLTKETNAGKMGYEIFTADALDIVGAGITSGNRKIKFWNEGGATFAGAVNLNGTLQANGNPGTNGQVLTSNGTSAPTWENTALSNTTRFAATGGNGVNNYDPLNYITVYNTNPADVTIVNNTITINKTGLYHIEGNMDVDAEYFPGAAYVPHFRLNMMLNSLTSPYAQLMNDIMYKDGLITSGQDEYRITRPFTLEIYIAAGSVLKFVPVIFPATAPSSLLASYELNLRGHLISQ